MSWMQHGEVSIKRGVTSFRDELSCQLVMSFWHCWASKYHVRIMQCCASKLVVVVIIL